MTEIQTARAILVRRIVADVTERSFRGCHEGIRFRADLDLRGNAEDEITWRISRELGVEIKPVDWSDWSTIGDLVKFVEMAIQRERAAS